MKYPAKRGRRHNRTFNEKFDPGEYRRAPASEEIIALIAGAPTLNQIQERAKRAWGEHLNRLTAPVSTRAASTIPASQQEIRDMTVSLYKSTSTGTVDVVVQTNAQSLDVFVAGLAQALEQALIATAKEEQGDLQKVIGATLRNAFPIAFAIAGYKSEKVNRVELLTCGQATPDASELMAQSRI